MKKPRRIRIRGYKNETRAVQTYQEWASDNHGLANPPQNEWDGCQPWSQRRMSALEEDYYEALEELSLTLRGRQKEIVKLLMAGELNQSKIGRRLGIARKDVVIHLRRIAKKIIKSVRGHVVL